MNRNLSKLLQSLAGVVMLSMASLSMAASYTYDFDADEDERGGQPLNFGDLDCLWWAVNRWWPRGYDEQLRVHMRIWMRVPSLVLGVCRGSVDNSAGGGSSSANKCFTATGGLG